MSEPLGRSLHASSVRAEAEAGAVDRLIDLYPATNQLEEVKRRRCQAGAACRGPRIEADRGEWRMPTGLPDRSRQ
jgi:hypothetical protein